MSDTADGPGWWQASDGKWYPPAQLPAPPPPVATWPQQPGYGPPPVQPAQGMHGCLKAFIVAVCIGAVLMGIGIVAAGVAVDDAVDDQKDRQASIEEDVELEGCKPDEDGDMAAQIVVTNASEDRSNYMIDVAFTTLDGAEQLETSSTYVNGLRSGQRKRAVVTSFDAAPAGGYDCDVIDVTRFSDEP